MSIPSPPPPFIQNSYNNIQHRTSTCFLVNVLLCDQHIHIYSIYFSHTAILLPQAFSCDELLKQMRELCARAIRDNAMVVMLAHRIVTFSFYFRSFLIIICGRIFLFFLSFCVCMFVCVCWCVFMPIFFFASLENDEIHCYKIQQMHSNSNRLPSMASFFIVLCQKLNLEQNIKQCD